MLNSLVFCTLTRRSEPVRRAFQILLIGSTVLFSWCMMQAVHEFGHVLHAWLSGGTVTCVVLDPRDFSRTEVFPNPHPQFVAWGGAIWGSVVPLVAIAVARFCHPAQSYLLAFFAGFCLIANGAYLAAGSVLGVGDAADLLKNGAPQWTLLLFGIVTMPAGLCLWHGLGPAFGLGTGGGDVDRRASLGVAAALILVLIIESVAATSP